MRTPTTPTTPNTSRSAVVLFGACAGVDGEPRSLMANLVSYEVSPLRGGIAAGEPNRVTGWNDLSRMKGNFQVRFLEGGGLATARLYSAWLMDLLARALRWLLGLTFQVLQKWCPWLTCTSCKAVRPIRRCALCPASCRAKISHQPGKADPR